MANSRWGLSVAGNGKTHRMAAPFPHLPSPIYSRSRGRTVSADVFGVP